MALSDAGFPFAPNPPSEPLLMQEQDEVVFSFDACEQGEDGLWRGCGVVVFCCRDVLMARYQNKSALLYQINEDEETILKEGTVARFSDSPLLRDLCEDIVITDERQPYEHHVFPFQETVLELVWRSFDWKVSNNSFDKISTEMLDWLKGRGELLQ